MCVTDVDAAIVAAVLFLSVLANFLGYLLAGNFFFAALKAKLFKQPMALVGTKRGEAEFRNYRCKCGWLIGDKADYEITDRSVSKVKGNSLFILHENLGFTIPLEVAAAVAYLDRMGYDSLVSAIRSYDEEYLRANQDTINQLLEKENDEKKRELILRKIIFNGRQALMKFELPTNFTIPLAIVHNWAVQNADAFNNKVLVNLAEWEAIKKYGSGVNIFKVIALLGGIALAFAIVLIALMIYQSAAASGSVGAIKDIPASIPPITNIG